MLTEGGPHRCLFGAYSHHEMFTSCARRSVGMVHTRPVGMLDRTCQMLHTRLACYTARIQNQKGYLILVVIPD
jgi:hypothetical protein